MRFAILASLVLALQTRATAQTGGDMQERIAALKQSVHQSLQQSAAVLKQHEWIETTTVSVKGEVKSTVMKRCYYGAEGKLQKIPVAPPQDGKKNEDLTKYMQQAVGLVDLYVPADPSLIGRAVSAGKVNLQILDPGKRVRFDFKDYIQAGDLMSIEVDVANSRLLGIQVSTYIGTPKDPVSLTIGLATFPDGTVYPARISLDAKAKKVIVNVENSGYRKVSS